MRGKGYELLRLIVGKIQVKIFVERTFGLKYLRRWFGCTAVSRITLAM